MSRLNYYYDPPDSCNMVRKPGELCDICSRFDKTTPVGQMVEMPFYAMHEEYECEEGDIHAHYECALNARAEYERLFIAASNAINKFLLKQEAK